MRFVSQGQKIVEKNDKLDIKGIKQPEEEKQIEKPKAIKKVQPAAVSKFGITTTMVNLRSKPDLNSDSLAIILGGNTITFSDPYPDGEFYKAEYMDKAGYIKKKYVREI